MGTFFFRSFVLSLLSVLILGVLHPVYAAGEFQADYNVQYAIAPTGTTIVTQTISLTNKQTNLYPQKYSILIDSTKIKNVIAYDSHEIVKTDITQPNGKTQIILTFNDKIVGVGKKLEFTLRYENGDIALKNGSIWEVNIPGVTPDPDIASYTVSLSVPQSFGPNAYMSPLPQNGGRWTKEQMTTGGVSAAYGVAQSFDVQLSYFLDNPAVTSTHTEIALPPDTAYQTVIIQSIDPMPKNILRDPDGNWLAQYDMTPGAKLPIKAKLRINLQLKPKDEYIEAITDVDTYKKAQKYWEVDNPQIQDLAKKYTTPRAIYEYVVSELSYDYSRVQQAPIRKGAVQALSAPTNSICMEFTDLFIAIARAAGIPARESVGYAYTSNSRLRPLSLVADVLHAWPEYYDSEKKLWIPVDPTWANTTGGVNYFDKLDFNHIVFALHGASSEYPYPAGFYRQTGKTTKDISVAFPTTAFMTPIGKLVPTFNFPKLVTAGIGAHGSLTIENKTGIAVPLATIILQSTPIDVALTKTETNIPPYAKIAIPLAMTVPNYFTGGQGRYTVSINGETSQYVFDIQPITKYFIIPIVSFGAVLVILLGLTIRHVHLWKHHKKH